MASTLLKEQIKENVRDISLWMIVPLIAAIILNIINEYFDSSFLDFILAIAMLVFYLSFAISFIIVILNDYNMFYGRNAAFFDVLNIKSRDITRARFLNYVIMTILILILLILEISIFLMLTTKLGLSDFLNAIEKLKLSKIPTITLVFGVISIFVGMFLNISAIIAAITIGNDKVFKKFGKLGYVVVYIIISLVIFILTMTIGSSPFIEISLSRSSEEIEKITRLLQISCIYNLVITGILLFLTNYFHKNRLSVA